MVQLSIINPQNILPTFANLKLAMFYFKLFWIFFSMGLFLLYFFIMQYLKLASTNHTLYTFVFQKDIRAKLEDILRQTDETSLWCFLEVSNQTSDVVWCTCIVQQPARNNNNSMFPDLSSRDCRLLIKYLEELFLIFFFFYFFLFFPFLISSVHVGVLWMRIMCRPCAY